MLQIISRRVPVRLLAIVGAALFLVVYRGSTSRPYLPDSEDVNRIANYINHTIGYGKWPPQLRDHLSNLELGEAPPFPVCPICPNITAATTTVTKITDVTFPTPAKPGSHAPNMGSSSGSKTDLASSTEQQIMTNMREEGIVIIFKTGAQEVAHLAIHLGTTLRFFDQEDILFFSDLHDTLGPFTVHDTLRNVDQNIREHHQEFEIYRTLHEYHSTGQNLETLVEEKKKGDRRSGWLLDKYKFLHMVEETFEMRPNAKWYVFIETDSYVVWPNLVTFLRRHNPRKPLYMGSEVNIASHYFAHGGSGYALSHAAMNKLLGPEQPQGLAASWDTRVQQHCCGDQALGIALAEKGVGITVAHPFFNGYKPTTFTYGPKNHWCQPVVTMHHTTPADVSDIWRYERQREIIMGTENLTLFADLYHHFVEPHIALEKENWDNLSHGPTYTLKDRLADKKKANENKKKDGEGPKSEHEKNKETEDKKSEQEKNEQGEGKNGDANQQVEEQRKEDLRKKKEGLKEDKKKTKGDKILKLDGDPNKVQGKPTYHNLTSDEAAKLFQTPDQDRFLQEERKKQMQSIEAQKKDFDREQQKEDGGKNSNQDDKKGIDEEKRKAAEEVKRKKEEDHGTVEEEQRKSSEEKQDREHELELNAQNALMGIERQQNTEKGQNLGENDAEVQMKVEEEKKAEQEKMDKRKQAQEEQDKKTDEDKKKEEGRKSMDDTAARLFDTLAKRDILSDSDLEVSHGPSPSPAETSPPSKREDMPEIKGNKDNSRGLTDVEKSAHRSFDHCRKACEANKECFQFIHYDDVCKLGLSFRLGEWKDPKTWEGGVKSFKSGWLVERIRKWSEDNACQEPRWEWY